MKLINLTLKGQSSAALNIFFNNFGVTSGVDIH